MKDIKNINQLRFVYRNANDVCILDTFDILIIIMVVLKMLCDQNDVWTKLSCTSHPSHVHHRTFNTTSHHKVGFVTGPELLIISSDLPRPIEFAQLSWC